MRVASRNEGLLVQFGAKVTGVDICDDLTSVLGGAQEFADDFLETEPLWTSQIDNAVYWVVYPGAADNSYGLKTG